MTNLIRIHIKTKLIRFGIEVYLVLFEYLIMEGRLIMSEINSIDVDEDQFAVNTPPRKLIWAVQTPQIFKADLIENAYAKLMEEVPDNITDDAMVVEQMMKVPVKLYEGSYENIKITTPEDLEIAKVFLAKRKEKYHK